MKLRRAWVLLLVLVALPPFSATAGPTPDEPTVALAHVMSAPLDASRAWAAVGPQMDPLLLTPAYRGEDIRSVVAIIVISNPSALPFDGGLRVQIPEMGVDDVLPLWMGPRQISFSIFSVKVGDLASPRLHLEFAFVQDGHEVGRADVRRAVDVVDDLPCDDFRLSYDSGAKDVLPGSLPRFALTYCNGETTPQPLRLQFQDADTGRPLFPANVVLAAGGGDVSRLTPEGAVVETTVPARAHGGILFTLDSMPMLQDLQPLVRVERPAAPPLVSEPLDPVTVASFTPP